MREAKKPYERSPEAWEEFWDQSINFREIKRKRAPQKDQVDIIFEWQYWKLHRMCDMGGKLLADKTSLTGIWTRFNLVLFFFSVLMIGVKHLSLLQGTIHVTCVCACLFVVASYKHTPAILGGKKSNHRSIDLTFFFLWSLLLCFHTPLQINLYFSEYYFDLNIWERER